jgi:hypothetical protein
MTFLKPLNSLSLSPSHTHTHTHIHTHQYFRSRARAIVEHMTFLKPLNSLSLSLSLSHTTLGHNIGNTNGPGALTGLHVGDSCCTAMCNVCRRRWFDCCKRNAAGVARACDTVCEAAPSTGATTSATEGTSCRSGGTYVAGSNFRRSKPRCNTRAIAGKS